MKQIILENLKLENFRGQTLEFDFEQKTKISGFNKQGKSTCKNAFFWLLTGADEFGRVNYNLFDNTTEQTKEKSKTVVVSAKLNIDGDITKLTKTAQIGWVRRRGNDEYERKGNDDYKFFIDDISRTATEYRTWISENIANYDLMTSLLNINHFLFNINDWKEQRKLLAQIAGNITNAELKGDYLELFAELEKCKDITIKLLAEKIKNQLTPIKKALGTMQTKGVLCVELEVLQNNLPDISKVQGYYEQLAILEEERKKVQSLIAGKHKEIAPLMQERVYALDKVEQKKLSLCGLKDKFRKEQQAYLAEQRKQLDNIIAANEEAMRYNRKQQQVYSQMQQQVEEKERQVLMLSKKLETLKEENLEIKKRTFSGDYCRYCGQPLPADKLQEELEKFEQAKAKDRQENRTQGERVKFLYETDKASLEAFKKDLQRGIDVKPIVDITQLQTDYEKTINSLPIFEESEAYKQYEKELQELIEAVPPAPVIDTEELNNKIDELNSAISEVRDNLWVEQVYNEQVERMNLIKERIKNNIVERAKLEKIEQQITNYEQEYANIVSERVNALFNICNVKMFKTNKNGETTPDCVISYDGVHDTMNNGSRIKAGVDITNAFGKALNVNLPLFIDNYEALTDDVLLENTDRQIVILVAERHPLKIETL